MSIHTLQRKIISPHLVRSHWMLAADTKLPTQPPLIAETMPQTAADVAIIGGGFVGLWTAIFAKQARPDCRIVIIERDMCGGGASGRNGGLVMSWWPEITTLVDLFGEHEALKLATASERAIGELKEFCQQNDIDAHFRQSGWLWTATSQAQLESWGSTVACASSLGASPYQALSREEVAKRTGSGKHIAGVLEASNATVQPALLVAGLKRVALQMGVEIYENTPVLSFSKAQPAMVTTPYANLMAHKVVLATNAWSLAIPELKRYVMPVSSSVMVTDPAPEEIAKTGWTGGECITDSQAMIGYYHVTRDGRVAFGKGVAELSYQSQITDIFSQRGVAAELTEEDFRRYYPTLSNVGVGRAWTGPVDYTRDLLPIFGTLSGAPHISYGVGWSGNGISPSQIGGKILSAMVLGIDNQWLKSPLVDRVQRGVSTPLPPEPIRYVGGQLVRNAVLYKERREANNRRVPWLVRRLADLADGIGM